MLTFELCSNTETLTDSICSAEVSHEQRGWICAAATDHVADRIRHCDTVAALAHALDSECSDRTPCEVVWNPTFRDWHGGRCDSSLYFHSSRVKAGCAVVATDDGASISADVVALAWRLSDGLHAALDSALAAHWRAEVVWAADSLGATSIDATHSASIRGWLASNDPNGDFSALDYAELASVLVRVALAD